MSVILADTIRTETTFVFADVDQGTCFEAAGTVTCNLGNLAAGQNTQVNIVVTVEAQTPEGAILNEAVVNENNNDPVPGNDTASVTTQVVRMVDLEVTKTESIDPAVAGSAEGNLIYVVTVTNNGPSDATGVTVSEELTLPDGVSIDSVTPNLGTFATPILTVGNVASGDSETLTVVLTAGVTVAVGTDVISDTATVSTVEPDSNATNNAATEVTSVTHLVDLAVTKTESIDPVVAGSGGGTLTYVVTVTNNGRSDATGVALSEVLTLPDGVSIDSITPSVGTFATTIWTVGNVASGDSENLTVVLTAAVATVAGTDVIDDTATVIIVNEPDTDGTNNTATENTSVIKRADIGVTKSVNVSAPDEGDTIQYTINVANNGLDDATGVAVTELLSAGVSFDGVDSSSQGSYDIVTSIWSVGDLAKGDGAVLVINATVDAGAADLSPITNTAEVTNSEPDDHVSANDRGSVGITVGSDIEVVKVVDENSFKEGDTVRYTITIHNNGPNDATGVVVTDLLPAGVSFVSSTVGQGTYDDATGG